MNRINAHPPLRVWILTAALSLGLLILLANFQHTFLMELLQRHEQGLNLQRLEAAPYGSRVVVALGTSKTASALLFDDKFMQGVATDGAPLQFYRVSWSSAVFDDLRPALAAMVRHPPSLLFIESDLLLYDRQQGSRLQLWLHDIKLNIHRLFVPVRLSLGWRRDASENWGLDEPKSLALCRALKSPAAMQEYIASADGWTLYGAAQRGEYLSYLRQLRAAGTHIVLLNFPRSPAASAVFPPATQQQADRIVADLEHAEGFGYWNPPQPPESAYCDQGHLNLQGRVIYSRWLQQQLGEYLGGDHG